MSTILLCQTPDTRLSGLEPALVRKGLLVVHLAHLVPLYALENGEKLDQIDLDKYDVVIIDATGKPDPDSLCQPFHECRLATAIILLISEKAPLRDEHRELTCGNVLRLPFTPRKVVNRVYKLLDSRVGSLLQVGDLTLNLATRCVYRGRIFRRLTPRQAQLLEVFMRHPGQTLTREFLMRTVWNTNYMGDTRTLDVHVRWIRERIEKDPSSPRYLRTVRGVGYRFGVPDAD